MKERLSVGLCFSANGKFLYVASMSNIYQYDLSDSTWFHVAGLDTSYTQFQYYETMYMGSDGKIYEGNASGLSKQMSVIDSPDIKGAGCNFCPRCLRLDSLGANAFVGTPPCMPNYGLGAKTCWPLDIGNVNATVEWSIYPNPAKNEITLERLCSDAGIFTLFNSIGQMLLQKEIPLNQNAVHIKLPELTDGIYNYRCDFENCESLFGKLTIIK
jgi:hypothetical protein